MTDRCENCRAPVVREGDRAQFDSSRYHMDAAKKLSQISALKGEVESLYAESSDLKAFREAIVGWRENDWPSSFCRATAERLTQHGNDAAMQSELRRIGSPAVSTGRERHEYALTDEQRAALDAADDGRTDERAVHSFSQFQLSYLRTLEAISIFHPDMVVTTQGDDGAIKVPLVERIRELRAELSAEQGQKDA